MIECDDGVVRINGTDTRSACVGTHIVVIPFRWILLLSRGRARSSFEIRESFAFPTGTIPDVGNICAICERRGEWKHMGHFRMLLKKGKYALSLEVATNVKIWHMCGQRREREYMRHVLTLPELGTYVPCQEMAANGKT